jgi:hypothetical protein
MSLDDKGIAMNGFEMQILNSALSQVDSGEDSLTLANVVIKLTKLDDFDDLQDVWDAELLVLLISHERKTSELASFSHIYSLLTSKNLSTEPSQISQCSQFAAEWTTWPLSTCIDSLKVRLSPFKSLRMA